MEADAGAPAGRSARPWCVGKSDTSTRTLPSRRPGLPKKKGGGPASPSWPAQSARPKVHRGTRACSEHTRLVSPGNLQAFDPLRGFVDDMPARRGEPYAGLLAREQHLTPEFALREPLEQNEEARAQLVQAVALLRAQAVQGRAHALGDDNEGFRLAIENMGP